MASNKSGDKPSKPQPQPKVSLTTKVKAQLIAAKAQKILPFEMLAQFKREVEMNVAGLSTPEELVEGGRDPAFALYASVQQMVSLFGELLCRCLSFGLSGNGSKSSKMITCRAIRP